MKVMIFQTLVSDFMSCLIFIGILLLNFYFICTDKNHGFSSDKKVVMEKSSSNLVPSKQTSGVPFDIEQRTKTVNQKDSDVKTPKSGE